MNSKLRKCNGLETVFVAENVRFAAGISFSPEAVDDVRASISGACRAILCGRLEVTDNESVPHIRLTEEGSELDITSVKMPTSGLARALDQFVAEEIPAYGTIRFQLLTNEDTSKCCGFCINANHALIDGRAMQIFLEYAICLVKSSSTLQPSSMDNIKSVPEEWGVVTEAVVADINIQGPPFLPLPAAN